MLPLKLLMLGPVPPQAKLAAWLLLQLADKAKPLVENFLQDPTGAVGRMGDLLFWQGASGRQVIGTLEAMSESQARIERVVGHIETAQIALAGGLGALTSLSMATLGVASLAAGFMVWRLNALHDRLNVIGTQLSDMLANLQAKDQAPLQAGLRFLVRYEETHDEKHLGEALARATDATELYRLLVLREAQGQRRLLSLNECGRFYLLALTAQARCQILANRLAQAEKEIVGEKAALAALTRATFEEVMGKCPEVYLDPKLQGDNVTLDLVTEVYQQAHHLGAVSGTEFKDAGQMFEHFRPKIYAAGSWFRPAGRAKDRLLTKLKYLMACLEEVGRIESLRLRVGEALRGSISFQELEKAVAALRGQASPPTGEGAPESVVAFAVA